MTRAEIGEIFDNYGVAELEISKKFAEVYEKNPQLLSKEQVEVVGCMFQIMGVAERFLGWTPDCSQQNLIDAGHQEYGLSRSEFQRFHDNLKAGLEQLYPELKGNSIYEIAAQVDPDWVEEHGDEVWFKIAKLQTRLKKHLECTIEDTSDPSCFEVVIPHLEDVSTWGYRFEVAYTQEGWSTLFGLLPKIKVAYTAVASAFISSDITSAVSRGIKREDIRYDSTRRVFYVAISSYRYNLNPHGMHLYVLRNLSNMCSEEYCEKLVYALAPAFERVHYQETISAEKDHVCLVSKDRPAEYHYFGFCRHGMIAMIDFLMRVPIQNVERFESFC